MSSALKPLQKHCQKLYLLQTIIERMLTSDLGSSPKWCRSRRPLTIAALNIPHTHCKQIRVQKTDAMLTLGSRPKWRRSRRPLTSAALKTSSTCRNCGLCSVAISCSCDLQERCANSISVQWGCSLWCGPFLDSSRDTALAQGVTQRNALVGCRTLEHALGVGQQGNE